MWFLNKRTGLKWEVEDSEIINRLIKDENYESIKVLKELTGSEYKDFTKQKLIDYALNELDIQLDESLIRGELIKAIKREVELRKAGEK